jgi:hypothetical protein
VTTTPENERGTMGGNATTSQHVERRQRVERMSGKGGVMKSDATTSQGKQEANGSGRWKQRGALRGSNALRGQAAEVGQQEALLQPARKLRGMVAGQEIGLQRRHNMKQLDNQPGQTKVEWEVGGGGGASRGRDMPRGCAAEVAQ